MGSRTYINFGGVGATASRPNLRRNVDSCADTSCLVRGIDIAGRKYTVSAAELACRRKTEITNLDTVHTVDACTNENVVWLEITVHDAEAVDMSKALE